MLRCITIDELLPGMYVNQVLDDTGKVKVRSKGVVRSEDVIAVLRSKGVERVEIDCSKGLAPAEEMQALQPSAIDSPDDNITDKALLPPQQQGITSESLQDAEVLYQKAVTIQQRFLEQIKMGKGADVSKLTALTQNILESVLENKDALMCLSMIQRGKDFLLEHSINCSIYLAILTNELGYSQKEVEQASLAGLLMDTGLVTLPDELCVHDKHLNDAQRKQYQQHVAESLALLSQSEGITDTVIDIIGQHHERVDGSGYPNQLHEADILPLAKAAAVIDEFSRLGMPGPFGRSLPNNKVLKALSQNQGLDQSLVNRLIGVLGIYPVGSLVRLSSGKLGIVSQKNPSNLLTPVVMTFYSINTGHYSEIKRLDLAKTTDEIVASIGPEEFAINLPKFFSEVFIHQMPA
ncbi:HD-GYP domain-containing protein [Aestuariibacter sp. GS-14]|uniref:HD-GYP domain-containing protein n=1 Tax=Aestuariibacter sp. GS-14 TaxID=2590670 RepID=UPI0015E84457|nr:HD-GYP domain-containing protein [Aestuariibacter sp. GS-14]